MSKARDEYLEYEITNGLNPKIHNYVSELEQQKSDLTEIIKDKIIDYDLMKYKCMQMNDLLKKIDEHVLTMPYKNRIAELLK